MEGILFAFGALLCWGFGDFFIQRNVRKIGSWKALAFIGVSALIFLFPFIYKELPLLFSSSRDITILTLGSIVMLSASLFDFEALRRGKIAIIEPIYGVEVPVVVGLSIGIWGEHLSFVQLILIGAVFLGIVLAITEHHNNLHYHKRIFEKGVILALVGAIGMGLGNFIVGVASQTISPLLAMWFIHGLLGIFCVIYLIFKKDLKVVSDFRNNRNIILVMCIFDNVAWICYAFATTLIPISITTTITESYIVLAALLGVVFNKEKLKPHQFIGVAIAIVSVIVLAGISE